MMTKYSLFIRMLFCRSRLNILIFLSILEAENILVIILKLQLMTFSFKNTLGYQLRLMQVFSFVLASFAV